MAIRFTHLLLVLLVDQVKCVYDKADPLKLSTDPLKLHYFPVKARGFLAELALRQAGLPYERVYPKDWMALKPTMPFGQLPVLEGGGIGKLAQSMAIARFAAHIGGMEPNEPAAWAKSEMLIEEQNDIYDEMRNAKASKDDSAYDQFFETRAPTHLKYLDALLDSDDGTPYFGMELTLGDLAIFSVFNIMRDLKPTVLDPFPKLLTFYSAVAELPAIADYLAKEMPPAYFQLPTKKEL